MTRYAKITSPAGQYAKPFIAEHVKGVHKMACCDCGLVHNMKFTAWLKVYKGGKMVGYQRLRASGHVVMIEAARDERATAAKRRKRQVCVKRK